MPHFTIIECSKDEIFELIKQMEEKEFADARKEIDLMSNNFIVSLIKLVKAVVIDENFGELADKYCDFLLKAPCETKRAFVMSFIIALDDVIDDIVGLAREHHLLYKDKKKDDEKKVAKKSYSKKETHKL